MMVLARLETSDRAVCEAEMCEHEMSVREVMSERVVTWDLVVIRDHEQILVPVPALTQVQVAIQVVALTCEREPIRELAVMSVPELMLGRAM